MEIYTGNRKAEISLLEKNENNVKLLIDGKEFVADIVMAENGSCSLIHEGNSFKVDLIRSEGGKHYDVNILNRSFHIDIVDTQAKYLRLRKQTVERQENKIISPIPGKIVRINVQEGDRIAAGEIALVLEAMKMQSNYKVTADCMVRKILVNEGDAVNANQELILLDIIKED